MQINFVRGLVSLTFLGEKNPEVPLAQIRKHKYMKMVTTSKKELQPERLPPTENAIKFHSFRAYLQVQQWLGVDMDETLWGQKKEKDVLVPVKRDKVSAHKRIKINFQDKFITSTLSSYRKNLSRFKHWIFFIYSFIYLRSGFCTSTHS